MYTLLKSATVALGLALAAFTVAPAAEALPLITGSFAFAGFGSLPSGQTLLTTDTIDFDGLINAGAGTLDYSGVSGVGTIVSALTFSPFSGPVSDFFSIDGFTFSLNEINSVARSGPASGPGEDTLTIVGTGVVTDSTPGLYAPTGGTVTITANGTTGGMSISFSGTAQSVPEPATLALFGVGLTGLALTYRRRRKA